jgi:imidazolonepropionase
MNRADLAVLNCSHLLTCRGPIPKKKSSLQDIGLIKNGCIASLDGTIVFIGDEKTFNRDVKMTENHVRIDGRGLTALPGFVDPHTHLPFAGSREDEFNLRVKGYTYQQLARQGLGIQTTVNATRQASEEELLSLCLSRLDSMLVHGTTTVEAKSGYGLNKKDELKQLRVLKKANAAHTIDIVPTFMGAHEVPKEYKDQKAEYISLLKQEVLPEVKQQDLAEFFDVFCEEGVYSVEETRELIYEAKKAGFKIKIHADEFASLGGAQLAVEVGAASAEHLIAISDKGIEKMAQSPTAAILLPGVSFFLMQQKTAPARKMIDRGVIVALATDFNPGSSMTESMLFILQLAVFTLKMGIEEAINAATANASYALGREKQVGSLEVGKKMDLVLWDVPTYPYLVYHLGINPLKHVIKNGKVVVEDRMICQSPGTPS